MRTRLICALAVSAILAATARAQGPTGSVPPGSGPPDSVPPAQLPEAVGPTIAMPVNVDAPLSRGAGRVWVTNEVLTWWIQGMQVPALLTTSPAGTPAAAAGVLGANGSSTVFGPTNVDDAARLGWRFTAGTWFSDAQCRGIEFQFLAMNHGGNTFSAFSPNGNPILARPSIDVFTRANVAEPISVPGVASGSIRISTATAGLFGGGFLLRENFYDSDDPLSSRSIYRANQDMPPSRWRMRFDSLLGFRYVRLADHLEINDNVIAAAALNGIPAGGALQRIDRFDSHNNFYGADLGISGEIRTGRWALGTVAKVAVGANDASVDTFGGRSVNGVATGGGFLVQKTNFGHFTRVTASAIPELGLKAGVDITNNLHLSFGYSFLYWYHAVRAGNQIDALTDPAFLSQGAATGVTPTRPAFSFQERGIWVQGVSIGLEWQY